MLVPRLLPQIIQRGLQAEEVLRVRPRGPVAPRDVLRERLRVLHAGELCVVRGPDVDEGADCGGAVGGVEGGVLNGVAVYLADVEVVFYLGDLVALDAVGDAPDAVRSRLVGVL